MSAVANPMVAVICGSTSQREQMVDLNRRLTMRGFIVLAPGVFAHRGDPLTEHEKVELDVLHLRKIDMADEAHFIEKPNGSFGDSTRREFAYAESTGTRIVKHAGVRQVKQEPTEAAVEAAARALYAAHNWNAVSWEDQTDDVHKGYREDARAALAAAYTTGGAA